MTISSLLPISQPDYTYVMTWDSGVERSLLVMFGLLIMMQMLLLFYIVLVHFQSCAIYRQQLNETCRRHYGNFIFRRLLAHLDWALMHRPIAGEELICCLRAKRRALSAIRLFRRDAEKILYPECELDTLAASDVYCVLDDEENELNSAGYASLNFDVTDAFLESLLYPKRAEPLASRNKTIL